MSKRSIPKDRSGHELRVFSTTDAAIVTRDADGDTDTPVSYTFNGHAAVFDTETLIGSARWGFFETMAPGAFDGAIGRSDARFLQNHNPQYLMARQSSGTLTLSKDGVGLKTQADLADVSYVRDLAVLLDRRDCGEMSFAFTVAADEWSDVERVDPVTGNMVETELRTVLEVGQIFDVSTVTFAAYPTTDASLASARSLDRPLLEAICARLGITPDGLDGDEDGEALRAQYLERHYRNKHNLLSIDLGGHNK